MIKGLLDFISIRYAPALARRNIFINRQKSGNVKRTNCHNISIQILHWTPFYVKIHSPSTWDPKCEYGFHSVKFFTPCSSILESILNGISKYVNIGDIHLADHIDSI